MSSNHDICLRKCIQLSRWWVHIILGNTCTELTAGETLSEDRAPGRIGSLVGFYSFFFGHKGITTRKPGVWDSRDPQMRMCRLQMCFVLFFSLELICFPLKSTKDATLIVLWLTSVPPVLHLEGKFCIFHLFTQPDFAWQWLFKWSLELLVAGVVL